MKYISFTPMLSVMKLYERLIASVILMIALLFATAVFLIPNALNMREIVSEKQLLDERYAVLKRKDSQLADMDAQTYTKFFQRMERIIPQSKDFVSLFSTFDALEQKTNVTITQTEFQFGVVSTNSAQLIKSSLAGAYVVPFRAVVTARVEQVMAFLDALTDLSGRYMTVEDVKWNLLPDGTIKMNISGQAYFLPVSGTIGALDTRIPALSPVQLELFDHIAALPLQGDVVGEERVELGKENLFE